MATVKVFPQLGLLPLLLAAGTAWAHGDLEEQISRVAGLLEKNPRDAALHLKRARLYRYHLEEHAAHRDRDHAEADLARALDLDPDLADTVALERGKLRLLAGRFAEAEKPLNRLLEHQPDHPEGRIVRARVRVRLGRLEDAVADYDRGIAKSSAPKPQYFLERADAICSLGGTHRAEALKGLDEGIRRIGPIPTLHFRAMDIEVAAGDVDAALSRLQALMERYPRKDPLLAKRGDILKDAGRADEARRAYASALDAIERLPESRRGVRSTRELESRLRRELGADR